MDIIISDLHLGSPLFKYEKDIINLYNDPFIENIYILGDIFDIYEKNIKKILKKYNYLIDIINESGKTKVIIKGNHDPEIEVLKNVFNNVYVTNKYVTKFFNKETILIHGDECDNSKILGLLFFPIHYIFERFNINLKAWYRNLIHNFLLWKNKLPYNSLVLNMEKDLINKFSEYEIIIAGHTHLHKLVRIGKLDYINSGSFIYKPTYIILEDNKITLRRI